MNGQMWISGALVSSGGPTPDDATDEILGRSRGTSSTSDLKLGTETDIPIIAVEPGHDFRAIGTRISAQSDCACHLFRSTPENS